MSHRWTPEEDAIIRTMTPAEAQAYLPHRTKRAVYIRRQILGAERIVPGRGPQTPAEHRFAQLMGAIKCYATERQQSVDVGQLLTTLANDWEVWQ